MPRYPALHHRNFAMLWGGLLVSNVGTWMQNVAQSWLIYKMTGNDPLYLGWLGLSFATPMVIVPPFGGVVADRVDRVRLLYVTQSSAMILAALLAALTWAHLLRPWHILVSTFLGALILAFDNPTRQSLIPELVPRQDLLNALSLNSATFTGAALVGPGLAGVLLDVVGAGWLFMLNAVSFLAVIVALTFMRDAPKHTHVPQKLRQALFGGFEYAGKHAKIRTLLLVSALAAICARSYPQLLAIFADDIFHAGPRGYGALLSGGGAGALIGAFAMSSVKEIPKKGLVLVVAGVVLSLSLAAFAIVSRFVIGVALVSIVGIAATVFTTMISTVIQLEVPRELRGRVISLYVTTLIGLPSLGALGVAALSRALGDATHGAPRALVAGAAVLLAILAVTGAKLLRDHPSTTPVSPKKP